MTNHLEESFQRDIDRLLAKVSESAKLVERGLEDSLQAVVAQKLQSAYLVILRDRRIDELEKQIDRLCLEYLVRQQPVAQNLRLAYTIIKINSELERIGDYAESIARQSLKIARMEKLPCAENYLQMGKVAGGMFKRAMEAFLRQDPDLARATIQMDHEVDAIRTHIQTELLTQAQKGQLPMEFLMPLLTIARRGERVADQCKNICEEVIYLCTGEFGKHKGNEVLRVLFLDTNNACRSQMAEALGTHLGLPRLMFASAGVETSQIDPLAVKFLSEKGIDMSRARAKILVQVPLLEHYQVIVTFDRAARKSLPPRSNKTVIIDWDIADPCTVQGSDAEVRNAYERTCSFLRDHIKDLAEAMLGDINEQELNA